MRVCPVAQSCLTLCDPVDCSLPDSSVHGIFQEYWRELLFALPGDPPDPGIKPMSPVSPALQVDSLPLSHQGSPQIKVIHLYKKKKKNELFLKGCIENWQKM